MARPGKGDEDLPSVAWWRNNLTALSQYRNLLFIAYVDKIHVFIPQFPSQALPTKAELILELPSSRPGLRGYFDPGNPHAVNHLIVDDIGNEEILVVSCDDGDVIAYTLRSIDLALAQARVRSSFDPKVPIFTSKSKSGPRRSNILRNGDDPELLYPPIVEPWFLQNVGRSAWGLATHKSQRLLAVSSNTKEICIFAFSLGRPWSPQSAAGNEQPLSHQTMMLDVACVFFKEDVWEDFKQSLKEARSLDHKIVLALHKTNIPNITFYDSGHCDSRTYLASTDIEGNTFIWDIWAKETVVEFRKSPSYSTSTKLTGIEVQTDLIGARGWAVACLDPKAARLSDSPVETFGCNGHMDDSQTVVDISECSRSVPDNSQWHPAFSSFGAVPGVNLPAAISAIQQIVQQPVVGSEVNIEGDFDEVGEVDEDSDEDNMDEFDGPEPGHSPMGVQVLPVDEEASGAASAELSADQSDGEDPEEDDSIASPTVNVLETFDFEQFLDIDLPPTNFCVPSHSAISPQEDVDKPMSPLILRHQTKSTKLPFNLLQTNETDVHLFRDIAVEFCLSDGHWRSNDASYSEVICQEAFHQKIPPGLQHLSQIERLNMIHQIPELGVVAIGNQAGRVGILTMTRWEAHEQSGYKVECILPFKSQEAQGLRPKKPLMGIAIGPIQGHETKPDAGSMQETSHGGDTHQAVPVGFSRRFRLMMVYCDHTVLSYEISRPNKKEELLVI